MARELDEIKRRWPVDLTLPLYEPRSYAAVAESDWKSVESGEWNPGEVRLRVNSLVTDILAQWSASAALLAYHPPLQASDRYVSLPRKVAAANLTRGIGAGHIFAAVYLEHAGPPYRVGQVERLPDRILPQVAGPLIFILFPHLPVSAYREDDVEKALTRAAALDHHLTQTETRRGQLPSPRPGELVKVYRPLRVLPHYVRGPANIQRATHAVD